MLDGIIWNYSCLSLQLKPPIKANFYNMFVIKVVSKENIKQNHRWKGRFLIHQNGIDGEKKECERGGMLWMNETQMIIFDIFQHLSWYSYKHGYTSSQWWWTITKNRYQGLISFQSGGKKACFSFEWESRNIHDKEFIIILRRPVTMEHAKCQEIIIRKRHNIPRYHDDDDEGNVEAQFVAFVERKNTNNNNKTIFKNIDFALRLRFEHGK